jgi:hypothetical protein
MVVRIAFASLVVAANRTDAQTNWSLLNPTPTDTQLGGLAFGAGRFVAVGREGTVLLSESGEDWTKLAPVTGRPQFEGLIFAQAKFVALDADGVSYTSPDGTTWTKGSASGGSRKLVYGSGAFVTILRDGSGFATSPDGQNWTSRVIGASAGINSLAFAHNLFVAGTANANYLTSTDGISWTSRAVLANDPLSISGGNDLFIGTMVHGYVVSSDGVNWKKSTRRLSELGFANGTFFATDIGRMEIVSS